jgi:predicted ester cyclase
MYVYMLIPGNMRRHTQASSSETTRQVVSRPPFSPDQILRAHGVRPETIQSREDIPEVIYEVVELWKEGSRQVTSYRSWHSTSVADVLQHGHQLSRASCLSCGRQWPVINLEYDQETKFSPGQLLPCSSCGQKAIAYVDCDAHQQWKSFACR